MPPHFVACRGLCFGRTSEASFCRRGRRAAAGGRGGCATFPSLKIERPILVTYVPDESDDIFIGSQLGSVVWFPKADDVKKPKTFFEIKTVFKQQEFEEGLLGLAFIPSSRRTANSSCATRRQTYRTPRSFRGSTSPRTTPGKASEKRTGAHADSQEILEPQWRDDFVRA